MVYDKLTANINLNEEKLEEISGKSGTRQGSEIPAIPTPFLFPLLSNIIPEVLTAIIRQEEKIKGI